MQERKITFGELQHRVANVDYIWDDSFPVRFRVINGETSNSYEIGIGEIRDNDRYNELLGGNGQYIAEIEDDSFDTEDPTHICVLEFVDADYIHFDEIEESLRKLCKITDESTIILSPKGRDGRRIDFVEEDLTKEVKYNFDHEIELEEEYAA